ncbi:hypothetical protein [Streptomyces sp. H51]|uniref:hypothetical protein n=1 Tax=Streptomyces sp. H51 TaxID=3111770 RepID=UPI002D796ACE|nr:hypothetical protein [Streptomyces sp. H51]
MSDPAWRARFLTAGLDADIDFHLGSGLPGDRTGVVRLYPAMPGLIVDELTVPELLAQDRFEALVDAMVTRLLRR